ncbi:MAG: hypoxanthine phosphoribosyltransferase [Blastopirellula sp.]|nr:MAG: hypoxanthine phosphoribosyltransferase [Blastopirellula sp.]
MRTLITEKELNAGVNRLAAEINAEYGQRPLTVLGVLTGSVVLLADLIRKLNMPLRVGVLQARSYQGATTTPGSLHIDADMMPDIHDRDVLIVDDIFDTGRTLLGVLNHLDSLKPKSVKTLVLLNKQGRKEVEVEPDFYGFSIPDQFVVGYGLDYQDHYRNLPFVAALEPKEIDQLLS